MSEVVALAVTICSYWERVPRRGLSGQELLIYGEGSPREIDFHHLASRESLAPERRGLLPHPPDQSTLLFELGAVLYEALCYGNKPSARESILEAGESGRAPSLPPGLPRPLGALLHRLLSYGPDDRYQSVEGVLHDLRQLQCGETRFAIGQRDKRRGLALPDLVGRERELELIEQLFGHSPFLVLEGESGSGKSRLLEEARELARTHEWEVLSLTGDPHRQSVLGSLLEKLEPLDRVLFQRLQEAMEKGKDPTEFTRPSPLEAILEETLGRLPQIFSNPVLLLIDDIQWVNPVLLRASRHASTVGELAVLQAGRPEGREDAHRLLPLPLNEVEAILRSMAGPLPPKAVNALVEPSSGLPFLAVEGLRGLVEAGFLPDESGGRLRPRTLQATARTGELLTRRLDLLAPEQERVLAIAAVTGRTPEVELVAKLCRLSQREVDEILERAVQQRLLYHQREGGAAVFFHDRVRDELEQRLSSRAREEAHLAIGRSLEERPQECTRVAHHYAQAKRPDLAFPYACEGAARAGAAGDLALAESLYRLALSHRSSPSLCHQLADVLVGQGKTGEEARRLFGLAREAAQPGAESARVEASLARLEYRLDRPDLAMEHLKRALRALDQGLPNRRMTFPFACWQVWRQGVHLATSGRLLRLPVGDPEDFALRNSLYKQAAETAFELGNTSFMVWAQFRLLNEVEKYQPGPELGILYCYHLAVLAGEFDFTGLPGRHWKRGLVALGRHGTPLQQGKAGVWLAMRHFLVGRLAHAESCARRTIALLTRAGDLWEVQISASNLANILYAQGKLSEAVEVARDAYHGAVRWNNFLAAARALRAWAEASGGEIPRSLLDQELQRPGTSSYRLFELVQAEAMLLAGEERFEDAAWLLAGYLDRNGSMRSFVALSLPYLATWLRRASEQNPTWQRKRAAHRAARRAARACRPSSPAYAHAQRELALAQARKGSQKKAFQSLKKSIKAAERMGQQKEEEKSRSVYAALAALFGWPCDQRDALLREEWNALGGEQNGPSLKARLAAFLATAPALFESPAKTDILQRTAEALRATLKAEAVRIGRLQDGELRWTGGEAPGYDEEFHCCLRHGHPVILNPPQQVKGLSRLGARSAMLVPVGPNTLFLLLHFQVRALFREEDVSLCDFLSNLTSTALKQQRTVRALRDQKLKFGILFENAAVGLQLIGLDGQLMADNGYLRDLLSLGTEEETDPLARLEPSDKKREKPLLEQVVQGKSEHYTLLLRHRRWDGASAWTQVTTTLVRTGEGLPSCVVRAISDVSLKHLEQVIEFGEQQRQLLAMDLHDGIAQSLLVAMQRTYHYPDQTVALELRDRLAETVQEVRQLHREFSSPEAMDRSHRKALRDFLLNFSHDTGVALEWSVRRRRGAPWPSGLASLFIYRIITEALSNVRRHSQAGEARVSLKVGRRRISGEVTDDGVGLSGTSSRSQLGLKGIRLRCELLGGRLEILPRQRGTRLRFTLPLEGAACE